MHTRIFPERDSYIENSQNLYLKNFGRDELLEICVVNPNLSIYTASFQSGSFRGEVENALVECFTGILTGSLSGSSEFINGIIDIGYATIPSVSTDSYVNHYVMNADIFCTLISEGGSFVTEVGVVWGTSTNPTILDTKVSSSFCGTGPFSVNISSLGFSTVYVRSYAINCVGISYGNELSFSPYICLAEGTQITLSDGSWKLIEDITYRDKILVWNFDYGTFDSSYPVWIKQEQIAEEYNLLKFSDGSILKTIGQHRIFNKQSGKFTHTMTDDSPIGTITINSSGEEITLVHKSVVNESIKYYNIITCTHFNLFSNTILTSCQLNNLYPIHNMKFVKDVRSDRSKSDYGNISDWFYDGLRLSEQVISVNDIIEYINKLIKFDIEN